MSRAIAFRDLAPRLRNLLLAAGLMLAAMSAFARPAAAQSIGIYNAPPRAYGAYYGSRYSTNGFYAPSVISGSGRYYGQYSPALNQANYYSIYRPGYGAPPQYLTNNGPGSLSRLYYYGGLYRTPSRIYPSGSRIYGSRYNTYTSPYGANRPSGGTIIYVPQRVTPRVQYRFIQ